MKTVKLLVAEDLSTGDLGLMVEGVKMIDTPMVSLEGYMVAHDLLEHVNGLSEIGGLDDELEAFGAMYYVRGQTGRLQKRLGKYSPAESMSLDLGYMAEYFKHGVEFRDEVPELGDCEYMTEFEFMVDEAKENYLKHLEYDYSSYQPKMDEYFDSMLNYLVAGFNKAQKLYPIDEEVNELFWAIADAVDNIVDSIDWEGQEFELTYDPSGLTAQCFELELY